MNENTKEFRIINYIHFFEKSLNYMVGAILAIFIASLCWYVSSDPDWKNNLPYALQELYKDLRVELCRRFNYLRQIVLPVAYI